jgi:hypothetical protein
MSGNDVYARTRPRFGASGHGGLLRCLIVRAFFVDPDLRQAVERTD